MKEEWFIKLISYKLNVKKGKSMSRIYVTGHRNPDMDSICSAYVYAYLKNKVDSENEYVPVRLGSANSNAKALFSKLKIALPEILKDVKPTVRDVVKKPEYTLTSDNPVYDIIDLFAKEKITVLPVFDSRGGYLDLLSGDDINRFFLKENQGGRLDYTLSEENIAKVVPGHFEKYGEGNFLIAPFMVGAMEFDVFKERLNKCPRKPVLVVGLRERHIEEAIKQELPGIVLTGIDDPKSLDIDFSEYNGFVYISELDTAETLRLLRLASPLYGLLKEKSAVPRIQADMLFDDAKLMLMNSEQRGLSVFDGDDFLGFVTRRCFLSKPRAKLILMDHNETEQSVIGIEEADVVEIIDHHRLSPPRMKNPIYICSEPLGSTCTIVYEQYKKIGVQIDAKRAEVLLAGIISDTVMLKSPTTTEYDKHVVAKLSQKAGIDDLNKFSHDLFSSSSALAGQNPTKVIESDLKRYYEYGVRFAIGQVEVTNLVEISNLQEIYHMALDREAAALNLDWAMLLITDILTDTSLLFTTGYQRESRFLYEKTGKNTYLLPGVLSRKKQLLPEVLRVLED